MCLIAVAWRSHPRYRLALIANRDEFHARAGAPAVPDPKRRTLRRTRPAAGRQLVAGVDARTVAAVTNVRAGPDSGSGTALTRLAGARLRASRCHGAAWIRVACSPTRTSTAASTCCAGTATRSQFASNHPHFGTHPVAPGLHAMSNGAFDAPWPKSGHATRRWRDGWHRHRRIPRARSMPRSWRRCSTRSPTPRPRRMRPARHRRRPGSGTRSVAAVRARRALRHALQHGGAGR